MEQHSEAQLEENNGLNWPVTLKQLSGMTLSQQELLMKLGAARSQYPTGWRLVEVQVDPQSPHFTYRLKRDKLRQARRREGRYLLRTNLTGSDPAELWRYYLQLTQIEEAFRNLKGDLAIRPIYHQHEPRIEAHIFIAFLAYGASSISESIWKAQSWGTTTRFVVDGLIYSLLTGGVFGWLFLMPLVLLIITLMFMIAAASAIGAMAPVTVEAC